MAARNATFGNASIQIDTERVVDLSRLPRGALVDPCHGLDLGSREGEEELLPVGEHHLAPARTLVHIAKADTLGLGVRSEPLGRFPSYSLDGPTILSCYVLGCCDDGVIAGCRGSITLMVKLQGDTAGTTTPLIQQ